MTLTELTDIIRTANEKAIKSELKRLGYIDCAKHKQYKHISLTSLFDGDLQETDDYPDSKGKRTYQGGIFKPFIAFNLREYAALISTITPTAKASVLIRAAYSRRLKAMNGLNLS